MSRLVEFIVAGDPVPWSRARSSGKRRYNKADMETRKQLVAAAARLAGAKVSTGPIRLLVVAYRHPRRRLDWDNAGKLVSDALQGVAYVDDDQVVDAHVLKGVDAERPRTEVRIEELAATDLVAPRPVKDCGRLKPARRDYRASSAWEEAWHEQSKPRPVLTAGQDTGGT